MVTGKGAVAGAGTAAAAAVTVVNTSAPTPGHGLGRIRGTQWYQIAHADITSATRNIKTRFNKHPIVSVFFLINLFVAITLVLNMVLFMQGRGYELPVDTITEVEVFLLIFILIFVRVLAYTYRNLLKQRAIGVFFTIDLAPGQLLLGKFVAFMWFIFSIILVAGGIAALVILVFGFQVGIPVGYYVTGAELLFTGVALGMITPIMIQIEPLERKLAALAIPALATYGIYLTLSNLPVGGLPSVLYLGGFAVLSLVAVTAVRPEVQNAWVRQAMKSQFSVARPGRDYLRPRGGGRRLGTELAVIARKELLVMFRDRDTILAVLAAIITGISLIILYQLLGPPPAEMGRFAKYFYPTIVALATFSGAIVICAYLGLATISAEGRKLWLLKILPVSDREVIFGKTLAIIALGTPLMFFIAIPIQILARFPLHVVGYFSIMTVILIFVFTGLGIWTGTRFPNFDRSMRGIPDIMSLYFMLTLCVLVGFPLVAFPMNFVLINPTAGYLAFFITMILAVSVYVLLAERAAHAYGKIRIDAYQ